MMDSIRRLPRLGLSVLIAAWALAPSERAAAEPNSAMDMDLLDLPLEDLLSSQETTSSEH